MSGKRQRESTGDSPQLKRKAISLKEKLEIITKFEAGATKAKLGRDYSKNESTIRTILERKNVYKTQGQAASPSGLEITRYRPSSMVEVERLLLIWIEDCNQKRINLCRNLIKSKALSLFETVELTRTDKATPETFNASTGWFDRFKRRTSLHNVRVTGEGASGDQSAAERFPDELKKIIEEGEYADEQIFNADETGLFWKKMPSKTYLAQTERRQPGYKVAKDRLTLLLGGNASGDYKIKPMLIYRSQKPRALKGTCMAQNSLPVFWRSNRKAWMTRSLFEDWFLNCFCPEVEKYLKCQNLAFKVLLILDNAPVHPTALGDLCENVKVIFLPPNTTSLIQPMDQGVISSFKSYYMRKTFAQAIEKTAGDDAAMNLTEFWKGFNIKTALENIGHAWDEVTTRNMRSVWKKIIPHCGNDFTEPETVIIQEITDLGMQLGFHEIDNQSVRELLQSHDDELTNEDLVEIEERQAYEETDAAEEEEATPRKEFSLKRLDTFFRHIDNAKQTLVEDDPDLERAMQVSREIDSAIRCYKRMHEDKMKHTLKQTSLLSFLKKL